MRREGGPSYFATEGYKSAKLKLRVFSCDDRTDSEQY